MKVIVCGAGQVGSNIAKKLAEEGNDVTVIDQSPELIQRVRETLDVQAMIGYASYPDVLERAGAADADMIIAVTFADEVNMVACQVAHSLFNVPTKIARVRTQSYLQPIWRNLFSREHMPIDVIISPEIEVARAVIRRLGIPGAYDAVPFADGRVRVVGVRLEENCPVVDTPLRQLTELFPDLNIIVVGIVRDDLTFVPDDDEHMLVGDEIYFVAATDRVHRAMTVFGHQEKEARRIIIVGGGHIGLYMTQEIERQFPSANVKIIERDRARAEEISEQLERAVVIHGDALDQEILREARVPEAETIIAVTDEDKVNILATLLAKRAGCQRAMTLINNASYGPLVTSLGVDVYIDPRATTVSTILQHMRRGRIRGLYSVRDGAAEIIEAEALETSSLVGQPLRDIDMPKGMIVGAVVRDEEVIIPRGDTMIEPNDRVIMFAVAEQVKKVEKMFSVRLDFF